MRKIEFQDAFTVSRILKKTKLSNEFKRLFTEGQKKGASMEALGTDAIFTILDAAAETGTENMVYEFIASVAERTPEEIKHLSLEGMKNLFADIAKENNLKDFFKLVSRQMK